MPISIDVVFVPRPAVVARPYFLSSARMESMIGAFDEVKDIIISEIDMNFEVEGRPKWTPLKQATINKKLRKRTTSEERDEIKTFIDPVTGKRQRRKEIAPDEYNDMLNRALGTGAKILQDTGALLREATSPANYVAEKVGRDVVLIADGGIPEYGYAHLNPGRRRNLPQRFWANLSFRAMDEIEDLLADWVTQPFTG